jgi:hypothetical protein
MRQTASAFPVRATNRAILPVLCRTPDSERVKYEPVVEVDPFLTKATGVLTENGAISEVKITQPDGPAGANDQLTA